MRRRHDPFLTNLRQIVQDLDDEEDAADDLWLFLPSWHLVLHLREKHPIIAPLGLSSASLRPDPLDVMREATIVFEILKSGVLSEDQIQALNCFVVTDDEGSVIDIPPFWTPQTLIEYFKDSHDREIVYEPEPVDDPLAV